MNALGEVGLRSCPARLPPSGRSDGNYGIVASPDEHPDGRGSQRLGQCSRDALCPCRIFHLRSVDGLHSADAIGLALLEITCALQQPCNADIGFIIAIQKNVEQLAAAIALGFRQRSYAIDIFSRGDGTDGVCIFNDKVGDRGNTIFKVGGARCNGRIAQPTGQDSMAAPIGVEDRFERKALCCPCVLTNSKPPTSPPPNSRRIS